MTDVAQIHTWTLNGRRTVNLSESGGDAASPKRRLQEMEMTLDRTSRKQHRQPAPGSAETRRAESWQENGGVTDFSDRVGDALNQEPSAQSDSASLTEAYEMGS